MEPLNWALLQENCGHDGGLVDEVLGLFREDAMGLMSDLERAVEAQDAARIFHHAHRLKGALLSLAAQPAVMAAVKLEHMGREGDLGPTRGAWGEVQQEMDRLFQSIAVARAA